VPEPELPEELRRDPQAMVTILTTEHFNPQTARAGTTSEANGRAGLGSRTGTGSG
jgi:hypothetical protein